MVKDERSSARDFSRFVISEGVLVNALLAHASLTLPMISIADRAQFPGYRPAGIADAFEEVVGRLTGCQ